MIEKVTPMIHVPSVRDTVDSYLTIGFKLIATGEDSGELVWAEMSFGDDALFQKLKASVQLQEDVHDTFYGMREFIIRDNNGFWITFGEPKSTVSTTDRGPA